MSAFTGTNDEMYVTKRSGEREIVAFDKILQRIKKLGQEAGIKINYTTLVMKVIDQLYDGISTTKIDELSAEQCASMASTHPDYNVLAGRIVVSNHHKNTAATFSEAMDQLWNYLDKHDKHSPLVSQNLYDVVQAHRDELNAMCDYERDYLIDYFGFKTLDRAYMMKVNRVTVERPQHMWLRVAIGIHGDNMERIRETYDLMSQKFFTHATPTLFNAGTPHPQLSSCFLIAMESDSIEGIYNTLKDCALISKWAGGIGMHIHNIRASGSHIRGTNGSSNGIVPMLRVFNNTAKYVDQCVLPETIIYTTQGPKQIQHCVINETEIYNLKGETEVIQNVLEHSYEGEILEIETMHSIHPLVITPEHPVYVLRGQKKGLNYKVIKNRLDKKICDFEWVDAKEMDEDDMVVYPIPSFEKDVANISADDCYIYGIILGDGSMSNKIDTSGYVSMHTTNKKHIADFMVDYFNARCVDYKIDIDDNTTRLRWNRCIHLPFRYNDFYDENKEKRIQSKWLNLPIEKAKYILKGLLDTDGCLKDELVFDSTSYNLIESVRFLAMKMGVLTSGYIRNRIGESHETARGIIENKKVSYVLRIPKTNEICKLMNITYNDKQFFKFMRHENLLLSRVQKITQNTYNGILYDLQMGKEHNYLLHNGLLHNGGGKRNGSFAIYLEPWHADVELFLQMRKNHGDEELKARDLFYALWMPDLFMERIKADGQWTLMCPDECPGLADVYGDAFNKLYTSYETAGRGRKTVKARDLWFQIMDAQMETGTPYLVYKDAANKKSNQQNVGTIKSSNLCVAPETPILTDKGHVEIQSVEGKCVKVWNGEQFSEVTVRKTGENQELIEVYTTDGCKLSCTKYHKFYTINGETIEAKDLSVGDELLTCKFPVIDGPDDFPDAYNEGFWAEANYTPFPTTANMKSKMDWLSGICDNYGNVSSQNQLTLELQTSNRAHNVKLILQTCGIQISFRSSSITLSSNQLQKMFALGFSPRTTKIFQAQLPTTGLDEPVSVRVTKIVMEGRRSDTYCFTEPLRHAGVFGGLLTSQCSEILEYSDKDETAVCNLASIALPAFVNTTTSPPTFDYEKLHQVSRVVTYNLNRVIDVNYYPTEKTRRSNMRHRPIGIGVQGLADVFMLMGLPFTSEGARAINRDIFETIYHAAVSESCEMAKVEGPYETFRGSPADVGKFQFDLWGVTPSDRYDWTALKQSVKEYGMRNSLLMAPMPTASTSQILGYNECIEPITSNIYSRRTIAGEFIMANKYLMKDLMDVGMWNERVKNSIVANHGSIQHLGDLPELIREKYKTVWEIPMRGIIDMAADRGAYICQSQSLNLWLEDPNYSLLTSMHFYAWSKGLKTGIYYLRRRARHQAQQFTIEPDKKPTEESEEICEMCSA
jgi:ribonucleoside-diphosphate reductase alpha chain